jgi:hypothetical protein
MRGETIHRRNVRPSLTDPSVPNDQHKPAASVAEGRLDVQMTVTPLGEGALFVLRSARFLQPPSET